MRRIVGWLALALVGYYVVSAPVAAADTAAGVLSGLGHVADALTVFVANLGR